MIERSVKGMELNAIVFQPFSVVLIKVNQYNECIKALNFGTLKNFKPITAYMEILKFALIEGQITDNINQYLSPTLGYYEAKSNGTKVWNKGFKVTTDKVATYLKTASIFTTNKDGLIDNVIKIKTGTFKDTLLNLKNAKGLMFSWLQYTNKNINHESMIEAIYKTAKVIALQCNYFTLVNARVNYFTESCAKDDSTTSNKEPLQIEQKEAV